MGDGLRVIRRSPRPALPPRAIREVIANALVHRNPDAVTESKRVEIRIVRNRFIVTSPGGLVGVSLRQLGDPDGKVRRLLSYIGVDRDVADPWYTGNFEATYRDVDAGCRALLKDLTKNA